MNILHKAHYRKRIISAKVKQDITAKKLEDYKKDKQMNKSLSIFAIIFTISMIIAVWYSF